jgi:hypothetical protein
MGLFWEGRPSTDYYTFAGICEFAGRSWKSDYELRTYARPTGTGMWDVIAEKPKVSSGGFVTVKNTLEINLSWEEARKTLQQRTDKYEAMAAKNTSTRHFKEKRPPWRHFSTVSEPRAAQAKVAALT